LFLGRLLSDLNVTGLLNVGVAGSFNRNLPLGSLVQINEAIFGDLGAEAADGHFLDLAELGLSQSPGETAAIHNRLSATPDWLRTSFPSVIDLTVNIVTGTAQTEASRMARWRADTESMETAAVFLAAQSLGLPVAAVRAISNYTGPRNKAKWEIQTAIRNLNEWLSACIERRQLP
jgi:futalosine hydrolase